MNQDEIDTNTAAGAAGGATAGVVAGVPQLLLRFENVTQQQPSVSGMNFCAQANEYSKTLNKGRIGYL